MTARESMNTSVDLFDLDSILPLGVDTYPLQVGRGLEKVDTFDGFLGGSATNVAIAVAPGRGARSSHMWLTLLVNDRIDELMAETSLPTRLLGRDPSADPDTRYASWAGALAVHGDGGLVVGGTLVYPPEDDVAAADDPAASLMHGTREFGGTQMNDRKLIKRADASNGPGVKVDITPHSAGWEWTGLSVVELAPGDTMSLETHGTELVVLPLSGSFVVQCGPDEAGLAGRESVFTAVTDFAYVGIEQQFRVFSADGGRFALPSARARQSLPFRYGAASDVVVELRGAGSCSRQVINFCTPDTFAADRLIACEVLTPGGNWSSYPPHKHDEERDGETALEEIYYFEIADGPAGPGRSFQRVYGADDRPIDVLEEVRSGDTVLVPHGWHGPSIAAPGYDLYYLNVMAGPGEERAWQICDDPSHAWVRQTWKTQQVDPRLPMTSAPSR